MDRDKIKKILEEYKESKLSLEESLAQITWLPFENTASACIDHHRAIRQGLNEVIWGQDKSSQQILEIATAMIKQGAKDIIVTRVSKKKAKQVKKEISSHYYPLAKILILNPRAKAEIAAKEGKILIMAAGTSDLKVAEEAAIVAEVLGNQVSRLYDVGVAGLHRLLLQLEEIQKASVIIVVAGMEGALPSVVGGLASCPLIAVPTSVGYGSSFHGLTALLSMLNSCAAGITVVNIDNGFGAAVAAHRINQGKR